MTGVFAAAMALTFLSLFIPQPSRMISATLFIIDIFFENKQTQNIELQYVKYKKWIFKDILTTLLKLFLSNFSFQSSVQT